MTPVTSHQPPGTPSQAALPLEGAAESALRAAYAGSSLASHGITFERAMQTPHIALSLRRTAEAVLRARVTPRIQSGAGSCDS